MTGQIDLFMFDKDIKYFVSFVHQYIFFFLFILCWFIDMTLVSFCRKPKPNPQLVAQQVAQQLPPPPSKREKHPHKRQERADLPETELLQDAESQRREQKDANCLQEPWEICVLILQMLKIFNLVAVSNMLFIIIKNLEDSVRIICRALLFSPSQHEKSKEIMTGLSMEVTVGDLTVVITDYEPKMKRKRSSTDSHDSSSLHSSTDTVSPSLSNGRILDWRSVL